MVKLKVEVGLSLDLVQNLEKNSKIRRNLRMRENRRQEFLHQKMSTEARSMQQEILKLKRESGYA